MSDGPKLYDHKPKKVLKQKVKDFSSPPSMGTSQTAAPPPPPKESFARRYKFVWPLVLAVNLAVGAYLFVRTKKKDTGTVSEEFARESSPPAVEQATTPVPEKTMSVSTITEPVKVRESIPEEEQRNLFKWILEEKRKVKPSSAEEKKCLDEEKAILKQFIRSKSIPGI